MRRLLEGGVYRRAAFISKIKKQENEIMCQFKAIRYFPNYVVLNYTKIKDVTYDRLSISSYKSNVFPVNSLINTTFEHLR